MKTIGTEQLGAISGGRHKPSRPHPYHPHKPHKPHHPKTPIIAHPY